MLSLTSPLLLEYSKCDRHESRHRWLVLDNDGSNIGPGILFSTIKSLIYSHVLIVKQALYLGRR
jgi:hypothetical protein